jgi:hypothetical protein
MPGEPKRYSSGTIDERPGCRLCESCKLWVSPEECGRKPADHHDYAAVTGLLLCRFETTAKGPQ